MLLEARKYLYDIQQAIDLIDTFCAGKSFADYQQDAMLRSAVERQFQYWPDFRISALGHLRARTIKLQLDVKG